MFKGEAMGKTFPMVIKMLKDEVPEKCSRNEFCRRTGINPNSFDRYIAGISEPTTASLEKIASYFGKSTAELRGDVDLGNLPELVGQFSGFDFDICSDEEKKILLFIMCLSSNDFLISLNQKPSQTVTKLLELAKSKKFTKKQLSSPIFKIAKKIINDFINKYELTKDSIIEKQNE